MNIRKQRPTKVVLDTNVFISALLWQGHPHRLLHLAETGHILCFATIEMLNELEDVLNRPRFSDRINSLRTSVAEIMAGVVSLVRIVRSKREIKLRVNEKPADVDDVMFIHCAIISDAKFLISGDDHLLSLKQIRKVQILKPAEFLDRFSLA